MAYELSLFNIRVKIVEPGYAPTTEFTSNHSGRMHELIPDFYAEYAAQLFQNLQHQTAGYTKETDVAEKFFFAAATDERNNLRYPAGADSESSA